MINKSFWTRMLRGRRINPTKGTETSVPRGPKAGMIFLSPWIILVGRRNEIFAGAVKGVSFMDGRNRSDVARGADVSIVLKEDQHTGKQTRGIVQDLLTKSPFHPHGIKVRLQSGKVGRVQVIHRAGQSSGT